MEPVYFNENRYSYMVGSWRKSANSVYVANTPESTLEQKVQNLFIEGQTHLQHEEYTLALQAFQDAMSLILVSVHPTMPIDSVFWDKPFVFPNDVLMLDPIINKTVEWLKKTPATTYLLPANLINTQSTLPAQVQDKLKSVINTGVQVTSFHAELKNTITEGLEQAKAKNWTASIKLFEKSLDSLPADENTLRGGIEHDLAILHEKAGEKAAAQEFGQRSIRRFEATNQLDAQAEALATTAGIMNRAGNNNGGTELITKLNQLKKTNNFNSILSETASIANSNQRLTSLTNGNGNGNLMALSQPEVTTVMRATLRSADTAVLNLDDSAPELMGLKYVAESTTFQKTFTLNGLTSAASIKLDDNASANTKTFLTALSTTKDIGLLTNWLNYTEFVAYIPHMYFYIIPMSMGDCHAGMGNNSQAVDLYKGVLTYPYINRNYETVKIWTRLTKTIIDQGDQAYRNAKDNPAAFDTALAFYENVVLFDKTLNINSPLYANAKFNDIKNRVTNFLAVADPLAANENPAITTLVLDALTKIQQIKAGLNFFGFNADYIPPFSFEYLQNTARYFSQQASQTEQRYIQYKSQGENEEFRREQLQQQAEVAQQTVVLEQRGVAEAEKGIGVATASVNYANTQIDLANQALGDFNNVKHELSELAELEAWANAASVGADDQVKINISADDGWQYFSADNERRDWVIQRLARQRTRISQDLETNRLQRGVTSAQSYKGIAEAQVAQAQARRDIAQQRVKIAQLQQRQAEENRDFLDMREFGARLWYELAQQAKQIKQRYLDMATEIAFLMERAYNAETERNLHVIRYDYQQTASGNLMGADLLTLDIDYFTFDYITTTKTKKIPVKKIVSLADEFPTQFQLLKENGKCSFETVLADFDRAHPGFYLAKIRNIELLLVGVSGAKALAGTLRNIGVSRFRRADGSIIERLYPADVMALSQYEIRQDALAFRFNPNDLKLFENNGIDTLWQLDLPLSANNFDYSDILDVQLVLYYDGFFDSTLETNIIAALPPAGGSSFAFSLKLNAPDELYYLKNKGEADMLFDKYLFAANQKDPLRKSSTIKVTGTAEAIKNLKIRMKSTLIPDELVLTTDANGEVKDTTAGSPLQALQNKNMLDTWSIKITSDDNPLLVKNGALDLSGLKDIMIFSSYSFTYR